MLQSHLTISHCSLNVNGARKIVGFIPNKFKKLQPSWMPIHLSIDEKKLSWCVNSREPSSSVLKLGEYKNITTHYFISDDYRHALLTLSQESQPSRMGQNLMVTDFVVLTFFVFVCCAALLLSLPLLQSILMQLYSSRVNNNNLQQQ